jgi:hypothetical protein
MLGGSKLQLERNVQSLVQWGMWGLGIVCVGAFAMLNVFISLPIRLAPDLMDPASLWKALVSLYVISWWFGTLFDNRYQIDVVTPSAESRLPIASILVAVAIFVFFALMWWFTLAIEAVVTRIWQSTLGAFIAGSYDALILVLLAFWLFNIYAWRYYVARHMRTLIDRTRSELASPGDAFKREALAVVEDYICGRWQWVRFIVGGVVLAIIFLLALSPAREPLARMMAGVLGLDSGGAGRLTIALPHLLTVAWFAASEAVMWFMRIRLKFYIDCIRDLERRYQVAPLPNPNLAASPGS